MLKSIVPDSFAGNAGSKPKDRSPLDDDPEHQAALKAGNSEALARIAHNCGRNK